MILPFIKAELSASGVTDMYSGKLSSITDEQGVKDSPSNSLVL